MGDNLSIRVRFRVLAHAATTRAAGRLGYELHRVNDFYSPLPDVTKLREGLWDVPGPLPGIDLRVEDAFALLEHELAPFLGEFSGPKGPLASGYELSNGFYSAVDSEVLYAIVRWRQPAQVIELGSGNSSRVIAHALERNRADGRAAEYRVYDPYPFYGGGQVPAPASADVRPLSATEVPLADIEGLERGDVLFVDTTHTVKTGGDVVRIVLELLPALRPGVVVHFHDIFLPYEYPRTWVLELRRAWAEQYLLQAFLAYNSGFEVLMPCHATSRSDPSRLRRSIPSAHPGVAPGAFWIQRT